MSLASTLKGSGYVPGSKKRSSPLWKGPEVDGVTQSLLSRFLVCRERFRLLVVEGLKPTDTFNHRLEYGSIWHICEEALAVEEPYYRKINTKPCLWVSRLQTYARELCRRYPTQQEQVDKWYRVCKVQFPIYVKYWSKQPDVKDRTPLLQEQVFAVPYKLPSGRVVTLKGKWDSVDLIGKGKGAGIYLQENKTKSDINEIQIKRQLTFDLQTMLYLVALDEGRYLSPVVEVFPKGMAILGVRYNVVRRPLSGGKGTIVQHKPTKSNPNGESKDEYYTRLAGIIEDSPGEYFIRWKVEVSPGDIAKFKQQCLDPILEQLCDWWANVTSYGSPFELLEGVALDHRESGYATHWRHPFGVYNPMLEGGSSDLDEYLSSGSEIGLTRTNNLFPEL